MGLRGTWGLPKWHLWMMGAEKMVTLAFPSCLTQISLTSCPVTGSQGKELVTTSASIVSLPSWGSGQVRARERVDLEGKNRKKPAQTAMNQRTAFILSGRSLCESIYYVSPEQEKKNESPPIILGWRKVNCVGNKICWEGCSIGIKISGLRHALNPVSAACSVWTWASSWTSQGLFSQLSNVKKITLACNVVRTKWDNTLCQAHIEL